MTADTVGGVWTYALDLAAALARRRVRVVLATMGAAPSPEQRRAALGSGGVELYESVYRLEWMDDPWEDVQRAGGWLLGLERRVRPDVIHLNGFVHAGIAWQAPVIVVGHSCVLSWWEAVKGEPAPPRYDRYAAEVTRGLRAASVVVAPSSAMLRSLARHYGRHPTTLVIPNGRDLDRSGAAQSASATQPPRLMPHGSKEPFVFYAARLWDEAKNALTLADAAVGLEWPVVLAGDPVNPATGERRHFDHVRLLGRLDGAAMGRWLARAAVYASPARYEPFGLSVLEAALAGCALVLGDLPSLRELWNDAAVFVQPSSAAQLRQVLSRIATDDRLREALALRARARALNLSATRMAERYHAAYQYLVSAGRAEGVSPAAA